MDKSAGQNMAHSHGSTEWSNSFCSCCSPFSTCLCGCILPCFLFGKTQHRIKDPSMSSYSSCNGDCCGWLCLSYCGCSGIFQTIRRMKMRKQYGIDGNGMVDCLGSCFCPCCALIQEEKEAVSRTETTGGYQAPAPMAYQ